MRYLSARIVRLSLIDYAREEKIGYVGSVVR